VKRWFYYSKRIKKARASIKKDVYFQQNRKGRKPKGKKCHVETKEE
jgi:hypothetical protein